MDTNISAPSPIEKQCKTLIKHVEIWLKANEALSTKACTLCFVQVHYGRAAANWESLCQRSSGVHRGTCFSHKRAMIPQKKFSKHVSNKYYYFFFNKDVSVGDDERLWGRAARTRQQRRHCFRKHPGHLRVPQQVRLLQQDNKKVLLGFSY